jgi:hypothetical protein
MMRPYGFLCPWPDLNRHAFASTATSTRHVYHSVTGAILFVIIADRGGAKPVLPPFQETVSVVFFSRFRAFARPIARPLRLSMGPRLESSHFLQPGGGPYALPVFTIN